MIQLLCRRRSSFLVVSPWDLLQHYDTEGVGNMSNTIRSKIFTNDLCVSCNACITYCPCSEANIAVEEDGRSHIYVDEEKCINCGICIGCPCISD